MIITSSHCIEGRRIVEYIDVISTEVVLGTGVFSEFLAAGSDILGLKSEVFQNKLAKAKRIAFDNLKQIARDSEADAIISIDFEYANFTGNLIGLVISGTAVKLDGGDNDEIIYSDITSVDIESPLVLLSQGIRNIKENGIVTNRIVLCELKNISNEIVQAVQLVVELKDSIFNEVIEKHTYKHVEVSANIKPNESKLIYIPYVEKNNNDFLLMGITIRVQKIKFENDVWNSKKIYITPDIDKEIITNYRRYYGDDAISTFKIGVDSWQCICGYHNILNSEECGHCSRKLEDVSIDESLIISTLKKDALRVIGLTYQQLRDIIDEQRMNNVISSETYSSAIDKLRQFSTKKSLGDSDDLEIASIVQEILDLVGKKI